MNADESALSYLAGFFDGEGTICICHRTDRNSYDLRIAVGQKQREPLELFQSVFGGNIYRQHKRGKFLVYQWDLKGASPMMDFLKSMEGRLRFKKEEAQIAINYLSHVARMACRGSYNRISPEDRAIRDSMFRECRMIKIDKYAAGEFHHQPPSPAGLTD